LPDTGDLLVTGLNGDQDITVKVINCRELVQECILRNDLSPHSAKALGEVVTCTLMMGSGMKGEETLQVNLVGTGGITNLMAITDSELKVRGMVGKTNFYAPKEDNLSALELLGGQGQIQVVRNHPEWKNPSNGIVEARDMSIPLNLALYMAESEQRSAALATEVIIEGNLCRSALGIMVETLPGATEENVEASIKNMEHVQRKGLRTYLDTAPEMKNNLMFRTFEEPLNQVLDDCLTGMGESIRWSKLPTYRCNCGMDRVWRALRLLPLSEIQSIVDEQPNVEMKCDFCGTAYVIQRQEIIDTILEPKEAS
jgi:molecular chaperone Hsp33